jgi:DNA mismatch repair protein MutS
MFNLCNMIPKDIMNKCEITQLNKSKLEEPSVNELLNSKDSNENNTNLIKSVVKLKNNQNVVAPNVFDDLEVFKGNDSLENSIFNVINKTQTIFGSIHIKNMLENPTKDISILKNRQNILNKISTDMISKLKEKLAVIKELEEDVLWILRERNPEELKIIDSVYFTNKYLTMLNTNEDIMSIYSMFTIFFAPIYGVVSPIIFFILPYLYLYFFAGVKFSFKAYFEIFKVSILGGFNIFSRSKSNITKYFSVVLSIIIYFQNFMNTIKAAKSNYKIINVLHNKLYKLNSFISECQEVFKLTKEIFKHDEVEFFDKSIDNELFKGEPSMLSNKGKILVSYRHVQNSELHIDKYKTYFNNLGEIDAYLSIVLLVREFNDKNFNVCYTRYESSNKPHLKFNGLWHPYLSKNKSKDDIVCNSIEIGGTDIPNNVVLTGPNAGGKSTFIKAMSLSLLFSQTFGISFSKEAYITPLTLINTYLNIPDCKNKESLFEAEMYRARNHLNSLKALGEHEFSFIVMDEIFSSTNPEEGISGAFAICNKLAEHDNSIAIITTHFNYLTNLEKGGKYKNYKIPISRNAENEIIYPYQLEEGASDQHIALELLKKKGFDISLVEDAINICEILKKIDVKDSDEANESNDADESANTDESVVEADEELITSDNEDNEVDSNSDSNEKNEEESNNDSNEKNEVNEVSEVSEVNDEDNEDNEDNDEESNRI